MTSTKWTTLPVLDLSHAQMDKEAFLEALHRISYDLGFFYVSGHGIDPNLIEQVRNMARRFFSLSEQDKLSIEMVRSPHFRGYNRTGMERTRGLPDWREQVDIGAERAAINVTADMPAYWRLQGPNQWPAALPEMHATMLAYQAAATDLAIRILHLFALALGQPETAFDNIFVPAPQQLLKIIRYPGRDVTESEQGVGAHKDGGFVTILLQDTQAGLQVEHNGNWIDAPPIPGTFVVNVGELLEMASNGYLLANAHRVVTPPAGSHRLSVPFFFGARLDATVPVLELPPQLAPFARGLTRDPLNPMFYEVGKNQLKSRLRSHPDVAQRHHADLLA